MIHLNVTLSSPLWLSMWKKEPGYLSGMALGYGLYDWGFESRQGLGIFLFTTAFRPALRPVHPPIQSY
jgi:hypothetical protein